MAVLVALGWFLGYAALRAPFPDAVDMKINSAAGFALAGVSLLRLCGAPAPPTGRSNVATAAAAALILLAALTLIEYVADTDLGLDQLLQRDGHPATGTVHPGRPAPETALCFLLSGGALLLLHVRRNPWGAAEWLVGASLTVALLAVVGYGYGAPHFRPSSARRRSRRTRRSPCCC